MASWRDMLAGVSNDRTLQRAREALGRGTKYKLGKGGFDPTRPLTHECDCSGFVAWAIGIPRELPPRSGHWLATDNYWHGGSPVADGLFNRVADGGVQPGDLYVYPDSGGRQGHIGIVTRVGAAGEPTRVLHCSQGNFRTHGDAIQETAPDVFEGTPKSRLMQVDYSALRRLFGVEPPAPPTSGISEADEVLRHELLRDDPTLRRVVAERLVLQPTGAPVEGCAAVQDGLNYLARSHPEYHVDWGMEQRFRGHYGPKTVQALKSFQASHNLQPDGLIGHDTALALDAALLVYDADNQVDSTPIPPPSNEHRIDGDFRSQFLNVCIAPAQACQRATRVPTSITIAQAILESNWGRSRLSAEAHNYFGIKGRGPAGSVTMPTYEYINGVRVRRHETFRAYHHVEESFRDHADLLASKRRSNGRLIYEQAMRHTDNPREFAQALEGVYATDPNYAELLINLIDQYHLDQYDV